MLIYNDLSIFEAGGKPSTVVTAGGTRRAYSSRHERNGKKNIRLSSNLMNCSKMKEFANWHVLGIVPK